MYREVKAKRLARTPAALVAGALLALANVGSASANNAGSRVAYRGFPFDGIFTTNPYAPGSIALFAPGDDYLRPTFSPLGDRLVMFRYTAPGYELVLFDDVGNELEVLGSDFGGAGYLDWSPDGRQIAYSFNERIAGQGTTDLDDDITVTTIRAVDLGTRARRTVTTVGTLGPERVGTRLGGLQISWSGDGSEIAYTLETIVACGEDLKGRCGESDIMVVDAEGGAGIALTSNGRSESPDFSPDGEWIVFREQDISPYGGLFLMPRGGGPTTLLVGKADLAGASFQRFSPDSEQVVFTSQRLGATGGNLDLFLVDVTGGTPQQATLTVNDELEPSWAPPPPGCTIEITFGFETVTPLSSVVLNVEYSDAPGGFPGSSDAVVCEELNAVAGIDASFSDLDESSTLVLRLDAVSSTPIQGPKDFARCTWAPTSGLPKAEDFDLSTSEALSFAGSAPVDPTAIVSEIDCITTSTTSTTTTTIGSPPLCGDFDDNDKVSATDAFAILRTAVGQLTCLACICDVDGNGAITVSDALAVLRKSVGQSASLACSSCG